MSDPRDDHIAEAPPTVSPPGHARPPLLDSGALLQGHRTVEINHNGELYRLQATRLGKLILTK
jgi:hemin uptake protein HemP